MSANLEKSAVAKGLKKFSFHSSPKEGQCSVELCRIVETSVELCSLHRLARFTRFQQYVNWELPGVQAGFRKGRGSRDQVANIRWIMQKAKGFQENIYFCFIDYGKAFDCGSQQTVENS